MIVAWLRGTRGTSPAPHRTSCRCSWPSVLLGNKQLGLTRSLRALCAAVVPSRVEFFRYDSYRASVWHLALALGIVVGAMIASTLLNGGATALISTNAGDAIVALGHRSSGDKLPDFNNSGLSARLPVID